MKGTKNYFVPFFLGKKIKERILWFIEDDGKTGVQTGFEASAVPPGRNK
jgi:hypothetical protein